MTALDMASRMTCAPSSKVAITVATTIVRDDGS